MIFPIVDRSDMGRYCAGLLRGPWCLGMGIIIANFQRAGKVAVLRQMLYTSSSNCLNLGPAVLRRV